MKPYKEIYEDKRLFKRSVSSDGGCGYLLVNGNNISKAAFVVWSYGMGWDHVSVSFANRTPTWEEMCIAKDVFFKPDECCVQYHPAEKDYVNIHDHCLHIWRPHKIIIPTPPKELV